METDERKCKTNAKRLLKIGRNWETNVKKLQGNLHTFSEEDQRRVGNQ